MNLIDSLLRENSCISILAVQPFLKKDVKEKDILPLLCGRYKLKFLTNDILIYK